MNQKIIMKNTEFCEGKNRNCTACIKKFGKYIC